MAFMDWILKNFSLDLAKAISLLCLCMVDSFNTENLYILLHDRGGNMGKYQLKGGSIGPSAARDNTEPES